MTLINIILVALQIIGGTSVVLKVVAPLTKWKGDDKILKFLEKILKIISLDTDSDRLIIDLKKEK